MENTAKNTSNKSVDLEAIPFPSRANVINILGEDIFANDILERQKSIEVLETLISNSNQGLVIGVDGKWGTGKTTYLRLLSAYLNSKDYFVVDFDAWETDFTDDPFISLFAKFQTTVRESQEGMNAIAREAFQQTLEMAKNLAPVLIRSAVRYILKTDEDIETLLSDSGEKIITAQLKEAEQGSFALSEFRTALTNFYEAFNASQQNERNRPLVVIIDELDRCRPPYALKLLERVKHLFAVSGVVFVLGIDKRQLENSVEAVYGRSVDAQGYLQRFIELEYKLSQPDYGKYLQYRSGALDLDSLLRKHVSPRLVEQESDDLIKGLTLLTERNRPSLRDLDSILLRLALVAKTSDPDFFFQPLALVGLLFLKHFEPALYSALQNKSLLPTQTLDQSKVLPQAKESSYRDYFLGSFETDFVAAFVTDENFDSIAEHYKNERKKLSVPIESEWTVSDPFIFLSKRKSEAFPGRIGVGRGDELMERIELLKDFWEPKSESEGGSNPQ